MHSAKFKGSDDLRPHQNELHHLAQMAGLNMNLRVFRWKSIVNLSDWTFQKHIQF